MICGRAILSPKIINPRDGSQSISMSHKSCYDDRLVSLAYLKWTHHFERGFPPPLRPIRSSEKGSNSLTWHSEWEPDAV